MLVPDDRLSHVAGMCAAQAGRRRGLRRRILVPRHQLNILQRKSAKRASFKSFDRLLFAGLYRLVPSVLDALKICQTGDNDSLAPRRLPSLLALEIEAPVADQRYRGRFVSSFAT
jgi:hypothetical protein